jgi:methyl-accepting chemotaxis protein
MNHLSSTTQQTAAASEQLSATAEELSAQAKRLQDLMAFFRLANDHAAATPRATRQVTAPTGTAALRFGQSQRRPTQTAEAHADAVDEASFGPF